MRMYVLLSLMFLSLSLIFLLLILEIWWGFVMGAFRLLSLVLVLLRLVLLLHLLVFRCIICYGCVSFA